MKYAQIRKINQHVLILVLCLVSVAAIGASVFFAVKNYNYIKKDKRQVERLRTTEKEKREISDQLTYVSGELDKKKAYIEEWSNVYQQLAETTECLPNASASGQAVAVMAENPQYSNLYPELCVDKKDQKTNTSGKKIIHLTFDDGPSEKTGQVLDLLDQYGIKATFFVTYTEKPEIKKYYREIVDRGHTIAVHTASHDYKKIYSSVEAYLEDFDKIYQMIYTETGVRPTIFRYPGGSLNLKNYAAGEAIKQEMDRRGFVYYDWNVSSGDGGKQATEDSILQWVTQGVSKYHESVVLMHDTRTPTVAVLPELLKQLSQMDCVFEPLDYHTKKIQFYDKNY